MFSKKLKYAVAYALAFYVVSSPFTFRFVNSVVEPIVQVKTAEGSCPTQAGLVVHTLVFALLSYYVLCAL
jgi:hypothetical protein